MSTIAFLYHKQYVNFSIPWFPVSVIGTAVSFYIGFKNNQSYNRMWEARKIWGGIVNESRTWGMMVDGFISNLVVKNRIQEAINNSMNSPITYNIDNKQIINTSVDVILNTTIYEGLNEKQLDFLNTKFEKALQSLKEEINKSKNDKHQRDYQLLIDELKTKKPRTPILKTAWEGLSNLSNVTELAQIMEQGLSMF